MSKLDLNRVLWNPSSNRKLQPCQVTDVTASVTSWPARMLENWKNQRAFLLWASFTLVPLSPPAVHGVAAAQPASVHLRLRLERPAVGRHHAQRCPAHHADHPLRRLLQEHVHASGEQRLGDGGLLRGRPGGLQAPPWRWIPASLLGETSKKVFFVLGFSKKCTSGISFGCLTFYPFFGNKFYTFVIMMENPATENEHNTIIIP